MDIKNLVEQKFGSVKVSHGSNGVEYLVTCPHCGKRKLSINPQLGVFQCWHGCFSGSLSKLLKIRVPKVEVKAKRKTSQAYIEPGELVALERLPDEHQAKVYLRQRGFDPLYLARTYGVCYCKSGKAFAGGTYNTTNTIIIPVVHNDSVIGWQSRLLYNPDTIDPDAYALLGWKFEDGKYVKPSKYMTMPGYDRQMNMFNFDKASQGELVVVTEGAFDSMAVGQCAIATFGKGVSDSQVDIIKNTWKAAVLLLDPDAWKDQAKLFRSLSQSVVTIPVALAGYKDAGECPQGEIWRQIEETCQKQGTSVKNFKFAV